MRTFLLFIIASLSSAQLLAQATSTINVLGDTDSLGQIKSIRVSLFGDTLFNGSDFMIIPGISAENYIIDADTNFYTSVAIGKQEWLLENLRTTRFNDGTPIEEVVSKFDWSKSESPAFCGYRNDPLYHDSSGVLYNWHTVHAIMKSEKNVCPVGWHVPNSYEWKVLFKQLSDTAKIDALTADPSSTYDVEQILTLRFREELGGRRLDFDGSFQDFGKVGFWWMTTETDEATAFSVFYGPYDGFNIDKGTDKRNGYSIRCMRDYRR